MICDPYNDLINRHGRPNFVSVVVIPGNGPNVYLEQNDIILRIHYASQNGLGKEMAEFSVCVKPIHTQIDKTIDFIEWVELHRLLGVSHFTFYNHLIGPKLSCILQHYNNEEEGEDLVTVLPWSLPFNDPVNSTIPLIHTKGILVSLNDCIYRHRGQSKYLILLDLDEIIIPRRRDEDGQVMNYTELVQSWIKGKDNITNIGSFIVQNTFFYKELSTDEGWDTENELLIARKTKRTIYIDPHGER